MDREAGSEFRSRECVDCVPIHAQNCRFGTGWAVSDTRRRRRRQVPRLLQFTRRIDERSTFDGGRAASFRQPLRSLALAAGAAGATDPRQAGSPCTTASGLPGTIVVWTDSRGAVRSWCQHAPPSEALPDLVLNEIDYDQVGADAAASSSCTTPGSARPTSRGSRSSSSTVRPAGVPAPAVERRARTGRLSGRPGRCSERRRPTGSRSTTRATRASSMRSPTRARSSGPSSARSHTRSSRGRALPADVADSNTRDRIAGPHSRTEATRTTPRPTGRSPPPLLPGAANAFRPSGAPSPACSRAPPRRP